MYLAPMGSFVLEFEFCSAHFYRQEAWTDERNREVFGRCFTEFGHGHNYVLKVHFGGVSEKEILHLREKVQSVLNVLDHEHLNFVVPYFKDKIPTSEVILEYLRIEIEKTTAKKLENLELFETPDIGARLF